MMENSNQIMEMLLAESRQRAEEIIAEARRSAAQIITAAEEKAREECPGILEKYKKQAQDYVNREKLHSKMELQRSLLAVKQELVDKVIAQVHYQFINQGDKEWIELLQFLLEKCVDQTKTVKPTIVVPGSLEAQVKEVIGTAYPVVAGKQAYGFIFSFPDYDLNYESERLFTYQRETLEQMAARYLFSGDDNG